MAILDLFNQFYLIMATVNYLVRGKKNPSKISLRFAHETFSTIVTTPLVTDPKHFSQKLQKIRNVVEAEDKDNINKQLRELKNHLLNKFNEDISVGIYLDAEWTKETVSGFFNYTPNNKNYKIFLLDYCQHFIDNSPTRYTKKANQESELISTRTIQKYKTCQKRLEEFSKKENKKFKLTEIDLPFYNRFVSFLRSDCKYNDNTIGKYICTLKTFLNDANLNGVLIPPQVRKFQVLTASTKDVYLNEHEIDKIFNHNFNDNLRLKNARDLFIIGLRTGLRVSDFTRLHEAKIKDGFIEIETFKTKKEVAIPIHPQLQTIIDNGLPHSISEQKLNDYIKEICKEVGINEMVEGSKMNPKTNRKEKGLYPKHELITTHTARRSFASNLYGKLPNAVIMAITGHTKETIFLKYIKITPKENANMLKSYWEKTWTKEGYKPTMKVS